MKDKTATQKKPTTNRRVFGVGDLRPRHSSRNTEPSLTKQSFTEECDINNIINKFRTTGLMTHLNPNKAQYGYAPVNDFRESMAIVLLANQQFSELPANIRRRFGNSAEAFLEFAQNPENRSQMVEMGLATESEPLVSKSTEQPPTDVSDVPDAKLAKANTSNAPE